MSTPNPAYLDAVRDLVRHGSYPHLLGMELTELEPDRCVVGLEVAERHLQPYGIVHGGVLASLLDTATFWAAFVRLPHDTGLVNVDLKLNYLEAVPPNAGRLLTEGRCIRPGRTLSYTEAYVRDAAGRLIAHATSTVMALPGKGLPIDLPKFLD
ncbi:hypothetical protein Back2_29130 [Nocardioides baekrokdamisoli]|uniref:Thioesterase domain-containing protein n=1 Tax=Nocardioides baekrokdamisoli TaxID=1804624 RepID=A0A3G9IK13_9ACTN|nr:PaaI family thioesterase [Nocardioides baekrokdamisoli]BBH18626.1 hypothetical protein Back2_29130 [Nocardioides baekrokdamisoli]